MSFYNNKGSQWKKWDLHIHTPYSNNCYGDCKDEKIWEAFIKELEECDIDVIGINDYSIIDGYKKVLEYKKNGRLKDKIIFPVIEYRTNIFSVDDEKWKKINWHIIINNNQDIDIYKDIIQDINKDVNDLKQKVQKYEDFELCGINQTEFMINYTTSYNLINDPKIRKNVLLGFGYNEWDLLDFNNNKATKEKLFRDADFLFFSSDKEKIEETKKNFLKYKDKNNHIKKIPALLNASDKHNFKEKSGHCNDFSNFSWIKANSFEGLKIAITEQDRIEYTKESPDIGYKKEYVVNNISLINNTEYFNNTDKLIEFNKDLICIIGNKGSGKSVLGSMIVSGFDKEKSKIDDYKNILKEHYPIVDVLYGDTNSSNIQYFSQNYINSLLNETEKKENTLTNLLNRIVKSYTDSSFNEKITQQQKNEENYETELKEINAYLIQHNNIDNQLTDIKKDIKSLESKIEEIENYYMQFLENQDFKKYKDCEDNLNKIKEEKRTQENIKNKYEAIKNIINDFANHIKEHFTNKISNEINEINSLDNTNNTSIYDFNFNYNQKDDFNINIDNKIKIINNQILESTENIEKKEIEYQALQSKLGDIASPQYLKKLTKDKDTYTDELKLKNIECEKTENNKKICDDNITKRKQIFINYLTKCLEFKKTLDEITSNFTNKINELDKKIKEPKLLQELKKINIIVKVNDYCNNIYDLINNNKDRNTSSSLDEIIKEIIKNIRSNNIKETDIQEAYCKLNSLLMNFDDKNLKNIDKKIDFYNDFFLLNIKYEYNLSFNDTPFDNLSGGQKGTALLLLILLLDKEYENKILVIDQPEEQLDNATVNDILVPAFKIAKKKRQIFMITHNANLVINADADQVIVAKDLRISNKLSIEYILGGLENEDIKRNICDILEGGEDAFNKRKEKYSL